MKKVIWSSDIDLEDYKEFFEEEYPDVTNESEMYGIANDMNDVALEDERLNLDIQLENDILAIADIGCWNGRKTGNNQCNYTGNIFNCHFFSPSLFFLIHSSRCLNNSPVIGSAE